MHRVVVLALHGVIPFHLAIPFQVFCNARGADGQPLYDVVVAGRRRGELATSGGFSIVVPHGLARLEQADTIVVVGSEPPGAGVDDRVHRALRGAARRRVRMLSICTGAFVLAECGLLDGRRATTHWRYCELLSERYRRVAVDPAVLFVDDDELLTSAGAACGIDLCLYVVSLDHGAQIANRAARTTVSTPHRSGGQAQFIERPLVSVEPHSLEATRQWALQHLGEPLSLDDLARQAAVSRRTLVRRFAAEMGTTPLQWLNEQRMWVARQLLEQTDLPIDHVAQHSGFGSTPTLRFHFRRTLGTSPKAYRDSFRGESHGESTLLA
jgi:transcriptional regulator GlxA family with amidase domain